MIAYAKDLSDVVVLMPVHNDEAEAWHTLASFDEPYDFQVLVVDDGSRPPFRAPADSAGISVEVLRLESQCGVEGALMAGVETLLARRDVAFIARIDAGDLAYENRLTLQRAHFESRPRLGALGSWAEVMTPQGQPLFHSTPPTSATEIRRQCFLRSCFIHPAMMLRSAAVSAAGNYRKAYPAAEDLDLFLRIMQDWDCANLPQFLLSYVMNPTGVSATRRRQQVISTLRLQLRYFEPANPFYWLGLVKNVLHLFTPYALLRVFKTRLLRSTYKPSNGVE